MPEGCVTQAEAEAFIARAEQQQREFIAWRERTAREDAEFQELLATERMRAAFDANAMSFVMAAAMNPRISGEQLLKIATVALRLPKAVTP